MQSDIGRFFLPKMLQSGLRNPKNNADLDAAAPPRQQCHISLENSPSSSMHPVKARRITS
jgi:hypothetical protein